MHRTLLVVAILFTLATRATAEDAAKVAARKAAYAATRDFRHHLGAVLAPAVGPLETFHEFRDAVAKLKDERTTIEASDAMKDEKVRPYIRHILDLATTLEVACDVWQSLDESANAGFHTKLSPAEREILIRQAVRLEASRKQMIEEVAEEFDSITNAAMMRGWPQ
jgi:hypothetical protein